MTDSKGCIYVLTNPSFPEYVKIGYADNINTRLSQLNRSECTPFAFRIYATLNVANRLADKNIHKIIDKFKPELRSKENINGKMRVREFFAMSAKEALELLTIIGGIYGEEPIVYTKSQEEEKEENIANETNIAQEKKSPFSFYKCGLKKGDEIVFVNDNTVTCKVLDDRRISYKGKSTSLSALAQKLLQVSHPVQGTLYFAYNSEVLSALRKRLEDEGVYGNKEKIPLMNLTTKDINCNQEEILLYFVMDKYKATCLKTKDGFVLQKGSQLATEFSHSCRNGIKELRKKYSSIISNNFILQDDVVFQSSSSAAEFVSGSSKNGKIYWKNQNGVLLRDIINGNKI